MSSTRAKRLFFTLLKWCFSGAMLVYAFHSIDRAEIHNILQLQSPAMPLAVIALLIIQMLISTFRWQRIIGTLSAEHTKPTLRKLFDLNFISVFFNSCLPGTIGGDVVRTMLLKSPQFPLTLCAHSVILDRLLAVFGIFVMVTFGLPWLAHYIPEINVPITLATFAALFAAGLFTLALANKIPPHNHFLRMITHFFESTRRLVFSPLDFSLTALQAIAAHACFCLSATLIASSLGSTLSFVDSLLLIPPVLLLTMLPISVGGWGVREVSMVGFLAFAGITKETALTISVQFGLLQIIASLPGALIYLRQRK